MEVGVAKDQAFTQNMAMKLEAGDFPVSMLPDNKVLTCLLALSIDVVVVYTWLLALYDIVVLMFVPV